MRYGMKRLPFAAIVRPVHRWFAHSFYWTRDVSGRCWQRKFSFGLLGGRHPATVFHSVKLHLVRPGLAREPE